MTYGREGLVFAWLPHQCSRCGAVTWLGWVYRESVLRAGGVFAYRRFVCVEHARKGEGK